MKKKLLSLILLFEISVVKADKISISSPKERSQVMFTENKGQVSDQNYHSRPDVLFSGSDGKIIYHIRNKGISYQLSSIDAWKYAELPKIEGPGTEKVKVPDKITIYRVDIDWLNINSDFTIQTNGAISDYSNFYLEHCPNGVLNVRRYKEVTLKNIYNKIDLHYYEHQGQLKCDYIVAPNADYRQIRLNIKGAELKLDEDGSLILNTPLGDIREEAPIAYQDGKRLKSYYIIKNNILHFELEGYDSTKGLIIDPVTRIWGTYYGGTYDDIGHSTTTDPLGNVYLAGWTRSSTGIATAGSHQVTLAGGPWDAFLVKFNSNGVRQWGTYYGGAGVDEAFSVAANAAGDVYIAGLTGTSGGTSIATAGSHQNTFGGGTWDAFLVKFNSNGVRQWGTYYGGAGDENGPFGAFTSVDGSGNVYLAGRTTSSVGTIIATIGSHQPAFGGATDDAFLVKFNSAGVRQWGTYYGGAANEWLYATTTDISGNVYISGTSTSTVGNVIATVGSHQSTSGGGGDAYLVKFDSSGTRLWGTYYGGAGYESGLALTTDISNNIYLVGQTSSSVGTSIATVGSHQPSYGGGGSDVFLTKFNSSGVRQWGTYYGGTGDEAIGAPNCGAAIDPGGNIYFSGTTTSSLGTSIASPGSHQPVFAGGIRDAFLTEFDPSGVRQWGTYYGGTIEDYGRSTAVDISGNVYLAGQTSSYDNGAITTPGSYQPSYGGGFDMAFLAQFCTGAPYLSSINGPVTICQASSNTYSILPVGGATLYTWGLSGGWTGTSTTNIITTTASATNGTLSVSVGNLCGTSLTQTLAITVYTTSPGSPGLISGPFSICANAGPTNYSVAAVPIATSYSWNLGGGWSGTSTTNVIFASPGSSGTFSVAAVNACGMSSIQTLSVTVNANPTITVNSGSVCSGNSFTMIPGGANTYTFQGGSAVVSPTANTTYTVVGTSTAGCVSVSSAASSVIVNANPSITVNSGSICAGSSFTIMPNGAASYTIQGGNAVVNPTVNTSYTVAGTSTAGCLSANIATSSIIVNSNPTITVNSGSLCSGSSFTIIPNGAATYTFQGGSAVVSPTANTSYTVAGTSTAGCVSVNTTTSVVTVTNSPVITVNSGSICIGDSFTIIPSGASTYTFQGGSAVVSPTASTNYTVTGTSINGCASLSFAISSISVVPAPSVAASSNPSVLCIGESSTLTATGALTYSWSSGGNSAAEIVSPSITTNFTVTGTDVNGCSAIAIVTQSVDACSGIKETENPDSGIKVFPNPSKGNFSIEMRHPSQVMIYNTLGQIVYYSTAKTSKMEISLFNFQDGVYYLRISGENNFPASFKIIKSE